MSGQPFRFCEPALAALLEAPADAPQLLLHSGRFDPRWARRSILATPRAWFSHTVGGRSSLRSVDGAAVDGPAFTGDLWADLRALLLDDRYPPEAGRWIGYISYDVAYTLEPGKLGRRHRNGSHDWPLVQLGWCPQILQFAATDSSGPVGATDAGGGLARDFSAAAYRAAVQRVLDYIAAGDVYQVNLAQRLRSTWRSSPRALFARLASVSPAWYGAYLELPSEDENAHDPAGAECPVPEPDRVAPHSPSRALLSTSPELFLELADGHVITRPIKGTRPNRQPESPDAGADLRGGTCRRSDPESDATGSESEGDAEYRALLHSEKDAAELNMIVDLLRNDLGRACRFGSVRVTRGRTIESHPTVHHGVATIEGDLGDDADIVDLLRAALPGGSITGAPKVRAMQIIDELEPVARGPYCGCIGWLSRDACQLNLAIRTMLLDKPSAIRDRPSGNSADATSGAGYDVSFHVGGGIVADSDPAAEYDETLDKAAAMLRALGIDARDVR